jgi:hypothetical protein
MRLGVTGRSRTGTSGFTAHGSSIELRPHPSARRSGSVWCRERASNPRRTRLQRAALPAELSRQKIWRFVRESNPRLPARQAGTLTTELTKQSSIRSRVPAPPNRCGRFPPLKRKLDGGSCSGVTGRTQRISLRCQHCAGPPSHAPGNRLCRALGVAPLGGRSVSDWGANIFHFGCVLTRASRRMWCLAARDSGPLSRAHPALPTPCDAAAE